MELEALSEAVRGGRAEKISSASTFFWKRLFAPGWTVFFGGFTLAGWMGLLRQDVSEEALVLLTLICVGLGSVLWWWSSRLREVWLEGDDLVFLGGGVVHRVPLSEVSEIRETRWSRVKTVTLKFRPNHPAGDEISFVPHFTPFPFMSHPVVKELHQGARLKEPQTGSLPGSF